MITAAISGDLDTLKNFYIVGMPVDIADKEGNQLIHIAAAHGHAEIVYWLVVELKVNPDALDKEHRTPLHHAAMTGQAQVAGFLILKQAGINSKTPKRITPLHFAAAGNHTELIQALIQPNVDDTIRDYANRTALHVAIEKKHHGSCKLLIDYRQSKLKHDIVFWAIENNDELLLQYLLEFVRNIKKIDEIGETLLHKAADYGNDKCVEVLIKNGFDTEATNIANSTPLHHAAEKGHNSTVRLLVKHSANIEARANFSETPLHRAVRSGNDTTVLTLLELGSNIESQDYNNATPLILAARRGRNSIITILLDHNAQIEWKDEHDETALFWAVRNKWKKSVELLIHHGADIFIEGGYKTSRCLPVEIAIRDGIDSEIANILLNAHLSCLKADDTLLYWATRQRKIKLIAFILKQSTIHTNVQQTLYYAAHLGDIDAIKFLMLQGIKINVKDSDGFLALYECINFDDVKAIDTLLTAQQSVLENGSTLLHWAAEIGDELLISYLIKKGYGVNVKNAKGQTPLHVATFHYHAAAMKWFLENKADVEAADNNGCTALHYAGLIGFPVPVDLLLKYNASYAATSNQGLTPQHFAAFKNFPYFALKNPTENLLTKDKKGRIPLHIAIARKNEYLIHLLLKSLFSQSSDNETFIYRAAEFADVKIFQYLCEKFDINEKDNEGKTALHRATIRGNSKVVEFLLENGADIDAKDNHTKLALHYSFELGHRECSNIFLYKYSLAFKYGYTLLHRAASHGDNILVEYLIKNGSRVDALDSCGNTPLHYAANKNNGIHSGYIKVVNLLLDHGANIEASNFIGNTPLREACHYPLLETSSTELIQLLINRGAKLETDDDSATLLILACCYGTAAIVSFLLTQKCDINAEDANHDTAIKHVIHRVLNYEADFVNVVQLLLNHGATVSARCFESLLIDTDLYLDLLEHVVDIDLPRLVKMLDDAIVFENQEIIAGLLIKIGKLLPPNISFLHWVAEHTNNLTILKYLIATTDVNLRDSNGDTVLHIAALNLDEELVALFLEAGADTEIKNKQGKTSLHMVVSQSYEDAEKMLQNQQASPLYDQSENQVTEDDLDGLVSESEQSEFLRENKKNISEKSRLIAEKLIEYDADVEAKDNEGVTPYQLAARNGYPEIEKLIIQDIKEDFPKKMRCTLSHNTVMFDPVWLIPHKSACERLQLLEWLGKKETNPLTREKMTMEEVTSATTLARKTEIYLKNHPETAENIDVSENIMDEIKRAIKLSDVKSFREIINKHFALSVCTFDEFEGKTLLHQIFQLGFTQWISEIVAVFRQAGCISYFPRLILRQDKLGKTLLDSLSADSSYETITNLKLLLIILYKPEVLDQLRKLTRETVIKWLNNAIDKNDIKVVLMCTLILEPETRFIPISNNNAGALPNHGEQLYVNAIQLLIRQKKHIIWQGQESIVHAALVRSLEASHPLQRFFITRYPTDALKQIMMMGKTPELTLFHKLIEYKNFSALELIAQRVGPDLLQFESVPFAFSQPADELITTIFNTIRAGNTNLVLLLLKPLVQLHKSNKYNLNATYPITENNTTYHFNFLHYASYVGNEAICFALLKIGFDPASVTNNHENMVHILLSFGHYTVVLNLLRQKLIPLSVLFQMNNNQLSPLHQMAQTSITRLGYSVLEECFSYFDKYNISDIPKDFEIISYQYSVDLNKMLEDYLNSGIRDISKFIYSTIILYLTPNIKLNNTIIVILTTSLALLKSQKIIALEKIVSSTLGPHNKPDLCDKSGKTSLHYIAVTNDTVAAEMLLPKQPIHEKFSFFRSFTLINTKDKSGNTPLHIAAASKQPEMIKFLLAHGADPTIVNRDGRSCFHYDVGLDVLIAMLHYSDFPEWYLRDSTRQALNAALRSKNIKILKNCIEKLMKMYGKPVLKITHCLSVAEFNLGSYFKTEYIYASNLGLAVLLDFSDAIPLLVLCDLAKVDHYGYAFEETTLHLAAIKNHINSLTALLKHGCRTDIIDGEGNTALHYAAMNGNKKAYELLAANKADETIKNNKGLTPKDMLNQEERFVQSLSKLAKMELENNPEQAGVVKELKQEVDQLREEFDSTRSFGMST